MTTPEIRDAILEAMLPDWVHEGGYEPDSHQGKLEVLTRDLHKRMLDDLLERIDKLGFEIALKPSTDVRVAQILGDLVDCPGEDCTVRCNNRDHWVLKA